MFSENLTKFKDLPVVDWLADEGIGKIEAAYRIRIDWDESNEGVEWTDRFAEFLSDPKASKVQALIVGNWGEVAGGTDSQPVIEAIAAGRDKLTALKYLFVGDITSEESEISWIHQTDYTPIFEAYANLEHLTIRGADSLSVGSAQHANLRELVIQSGGLPPDVVHQIANGNLPKLQHLELWLGEPNYGGDVTVEDLAPLLKGERFPRLKYLGLKDSVIQDEVAGVAAFAPIVERLDVLDLSMGNLSDDGARALLASDAVRKLKRLDLHHHFISEPVQKQLQALGPDVDLSDRQEPHEWGGQEHRFIAVSE